MSPRQTFCRRPVILASTGELASATLKVRRARKNVYLAAAKAFGLYQGIIWRASFPEEKAEIEKVFGTGCEIRLAPDLTPKTILPEYTPNDKPAKSPGHAKFIFVSRIARKKNLLFFLQTLQKCAIGKLELEIVGPTEDAAYWNDCLGAIAKLDDNVR